MNSSRQIAILDHIEDITLPKPIRGILYLLQNQSIFQIGFRRLDNTRAKQITSMVLSTEIPPPTNFNNGKPFCINISELSAIHILANFSILLVKPNKHFRKFKFNSEIFPMVIHFVEQLLLYGIVVPYQYILPPSLSKSNTPESASPKTNSNSNSNSNSPLNSNSLSSEELLLLQYKNIERITLHFYQNCSLRSYLPPQSHIHLTMEPYKNLKTFWNNILSLYQKLLIFFDHSGALPTDPSYPLSDGCYAVNSSLLSSINEDIEKLPIFSPITIEEYSNLFDSNGVLKDFEGLKERIYLSGCCPELISKLLPFLVGIYPPDSSEEDRKKVEETLEKTFYILKEQQESLTNIQIQNNKKLTASFRVIDHDITRTDRQLLPFKSDDAIGSKIIKMLLQIYAIYNPKISYLQGMNDLFVPLLTSFIPNWSPEGKPLEDNWEKKLPILFWTYDAMLQGISQLELLSHVSDMGMKQVPWTNKLLETCSPTLEIWMKYHSLSEFQWMFSDFILLFKRSITNIWDLWLAICSSPAPKSWLVYFTVALFIEGYEDLAKISDISMPVVMSVFPNFVKKVNVQRVNKIALCLWNKLKMEMPTTPEVKPKTDFKFFNIAIY